ncbi:MAG TPA: MarR family winged helix-turn-helix transcriptional regulator [Longimicrobiales bacterium]
MRELETIETVPERLLAGIARIAVALRSRAWHDAAPRGLTPTQAQILVLLHGRPPIGLRVSELAEQLAITAATASDAVAALARKGLVQKERARDDARVVHVRITEAGRAEAERSAEWPDALLAAVDALSPDEQRQLLRSLVKMIRALQEQGQIPVTRMCVTCRYFRPNIHPDAERPHHCAFVDAPFGDRSLRLDCPDHAEATEPEREANWHAFAGAGAAGTAAVD